MSFGKSKVSRFGEKSDIQPMQRSSATEFPSRSRDSTRSGGIISASFTEASAKDDDNLQPGSLAEARQKLKAAAAKHSCLGSKIGKPNLKKCGIKPSSAKKVDDGVHSKDSYTTVDSCRSGPPSTRIPSRSRASFLGTRAGSFVGSPSNSNKSQDFHKRSIEIQFNLKAKRLSAMKRELLEKQKPAIDIYKAMMMLRNKYLEMEGKDLQLEELKIIEYPDLKVMDQKQKEAEEEKLKDMKIKLNNSPTTFMDLCRLILDEKCSILDRIFDDDGDWNQDDLIRKIQFYKQESVLLEGRIESKLKEEEGKMREIIKEWFQIAKAHVGDWYGTETEPGDLELRLQETEHKLKQAMADLQIEKNKKNKELTDRNRDLERELIKMRDKYNEANRVLEEERNKTQSQKERQQVLEHKMKAAKNRMKEAEMQKQELEVRIDHLSETIKKNSEDWKSKEIYFEAKHKELQNAVAIHKEEVDRLERERHSVDVRSSEIKKEFEARERDYVEKIQQLEYELNEVRSQKATLETEFDVLRVKSVNSEVYNHMFNQSKLKIDEENTAKTKTEMALWQELKDTRSALKLAEEKIAIYAEEKTRFLDTINENFDDTNVSMTATLMQKEELISTLILQNNQLKESVHESHMENEDKCMRIKELEDKVLTINDQLFQSDIHTEKEIYDLHAKLQYEIERNKELQGQLMKAQHDNKNIKEMLLDYENLLKIRDGLLNMMQEKRLASEEQNCTLKDYIVQMREQLNLTSTMNIPPPPQPLALHEPPSRENLQQFINHAQNLCTQEAIRFQKRLHSRVALQNLVNPQPGPSMNSSNRPQTAHSCTLEHHQRKTRTKIITTVSDIMRRYKSNEGFDINHFASSSSVSN